VIDRADVRMRTMVVCAARVLRPPLITLVVADPGWRLAWSVGTVHAVDVGATSADGVR
jgi:hypothetical protein